MTVKRTIRSADANESAGSASSDGLPREDISSKLTQTLIKNLSSADWKVAISFKEKSLIWGKL